MEEISEDIELPKVDRHQFFFETPLYEFIERKSFGVKEMLSGDVDAYNSSSGFETTYTITARQIDEFVFENFYKVSLTCKRNGKDVIRFIVFYNGKILGKIGQWPSLADIQFAEIGKKYDNFMSRSDLQEFKKAIGLAAHGVGAGSFVYLRRIFENLIREAFETNKASLSITETDFQKKRMSEKVELLNTFLPSQLVDMKDIYSVLSNGVHELSEEECLAFFPAMKLSIELILEQKIEMEIKAKRDDAVRKQIASISSQIKK